MGLDHELQSLGKSPHHTELEAHTKDERDAQILARLGKKSVLEVRTQDSERLQKKSCDLTCISDGLASSLSAALHVQFLSHGKAV